MKIRLTIHNNKFLLVLISIAIGCFSSYYELLQLFVSEVIKPDAIDYTIAISHVLFFSILSGILIYICTRRLKRAENILHFIYSLVVVAVFSLIAWQVIDPLVHKSNKEHAHIYEEHFKKHRRNVWDNWEREKRMRYFHDSGEDWIEKAISLFVAIYIISRIYNMARREEEMEHKFEKLKNESLQSQISALNNQINPHFFFNAMNALHSLIAEDKKDKSLEYLSNLSNVFRYILQSEKKDMVVLKEEFAFLETYRFMLTVKYEQRLQFDIRVDKKYDLYRIPVLSLLPIIENVIKHNEISNRYPMVVHIFMDEEQYLVIQNEKREKLDKIESAGIGLKNLNNRFKLLTQKEIQIKNTADTFSVCLPLSTPKQ